MGKLTKDSNLRTLVIAPDGGKQVMDTTQMTGQGKMSKDQNETNTMAEYTTGAMPSPGKLGGLPSRT